MADDGTDQYIDSEIVIGLVGAIGTNLETVASYISSCLHSYRYTRSEIITVSRDVLGDLSFIIDGFSADLPPLSKIEKQMDIGNAMREKDPGLVGVGIVAQIYQRRLDILKEQGKIKRKTGKNIETRELPRTAFIIKSLKNADDVRTLRSVYSNGFYLIGVYEDENVRVNNLMHDKSISEEDARLLMERDKSEDVKYGQHSLDTYQMSDFFVDLGGMWMETIRRIFDLIFGNPFITPTFDEFAMFMAYASSLRSADLSRQVGAVVTRGHDILALGTNDSPRYGGGQNWPDADAKITTLPTPGTDAFRGYDANKAEFDLIANDVMTVFGIEVDDEDKRSEYLGKLKKTRLGGLTEYGRSVHAEMEALDVCARNGIPTKGCTMYVTTYPCHNCAKHIIDMGISEVYYIEPYPKSRAMILHDDAISDDPKSVDRVRFLPFTGVGPHRFMELFAMVYPPLYDKKRKGSDGKTLSWDAMSSNIRSQMVPHTYLELESQYMKLYNKEVNKLKEERGIVSDKTKSVSNKKK